MKPLLVFLSIILLSCSNCFADVRLMCFYDSVSGNNRSGNGHFTVDNIDPHLCTHLIYVDTLLYRDILYPEDLFKEAKNTNKEFEKFAALKKYNPKLKLFIELKVPEDERDRISARWYGRKRFFIPSVLKFFNEFGFDGLHFSYLPQGKTATYFFVKLIRVLSEAFQPGGYLLGSSIESSEMLERIDLFEIEYFVHHLRSNLDYLIVNAYDFHAPSFQPKTADHPSALYSQPWQSQEKCADFAVTQLIKKRFPANKIVLGIHLYGQSWTLTSDQTSPPCPANGEGPVGKITNESGVLAYYEICHAVKFNGWQVFDDPLQKMGPYAVSLMGDNRTWVGYDDPTMAVVKAKYVLSNKLSGISIRDITLDDFRNICGEGNYPVTSAVWQTLFSSEKI